MLARLKPGEFVVPLHSVQRFAESFIALANAEDKKAQVSAALARKALDALSKQHQRQIAAYWDAASKESLRLLILVMENNPKKTRAEILKRPDVHAVLREPYEQAAAKSEELLHKAWAESEALSVKHTKGEFKLLGAEWKGHTLDPTLLDALVGDLHANAKAMRSRYHAALSGDLTASEVRLRAVAADGSRRARYSAQVAVWGVATQVRDSAAAAAGLNKVWIAVMDDRTCSHCKVLHGMVVGPGEQFPVEAAVPPLKAYLNVLYGPPRHPNCRCVIVPTKLQKSKTKS